MMMITKRPPSSLRVLITPISIHQPESATEGCVSQSVGSHDCCSASLELFNPLKLKFVFWISVVCPLCRNHLLLDFPLSLATALPRVDKSLNDDDDEPALLPVGLTCLPFLVSGSSKEAVVVFVVGHNARPTLIIILSHQISRWLCATQQQRLLYFLQFWPLNHGPINRVPPPPTWMAKEHKVAIRTKENPIKY